MLRLVDRLRHARRAALGVAVALVACGDGAGLGQPCSSHGACESDLQCLDEICVPRCESDFECGDGFVCLSDGICDPVSSQIGDACARERDCGPGQTCLLASDDPDGDGLLTASCAAQSPGGFTGSICDDDADCLHGVCTLGHCSEVCHVDTDCPSGLVCAQIPRILAEGDALFTGCLQGSGVLAQSLMMRSPSEMLQLPVPSNARSFALVSRVDDDNQLVGATRVLAPDGSLLFRTTSAQTTPEEFYGNPIRYQRLRGLSTLFVPNSDRVELEVGVYEIEIQSSFPLGTSGTLNPHVDIYFKLDDSRILDLSYYFLDLSDHPCLGGGTGTVLDAAAAPNSADFASFHARLEQLLSDGGIGVGEVSYTDIDRPDLDGVDASSLADLLKLSDNTSGIAVFFVRSLRPGVLAQSGGQPGPPGMAGTRASGIAISVNGACYRSWEGMARVTTHALFTQMGLFRNLEPDGYTDPISDSSETIDNLMHFSEFAGNELSSGQRAVLGRYPGLR